MISWVSCLSLFCHIKHGLNETLVPDYTFEVRVEIDVKLVYRSIHKLLAGYKEEKRGPTAVVIQSAFNFQTLMAGIPALQEFPLIPIHVSDSDTLYSVLDWQRVGAKCMINHFFKYPDYLKVRVFSCLALSLIS